MVAESKSISKSPVLLIEGSVKCGGALRATMARLGFGGLGLEVEGKFRDVGLRAIRYHLYSRTRVEATATTTTTTT